MTLDPSSYQTLSKVDVLLKATLYTPDNVTTLSSEYLILQNLIP